MKFPFLVIVLFSTFTSVFGGIIKVPTKNPKQEVAYKDLVCTEIDQERIRTLITTIAEKSWVYLLKNKKDIEELGVQISHVHPLKFLAVSSATSHLRWCLAQIIDSSLTRGRFVDGLSANLTREADKGALDGYIADFAKEVNVEVSDIMPYFQNRNWEGFIRCLSEMRCSDDS